MTTRRAHHGRRPRSTTARLWRWRRNPLRRASDRAEAWTVVVAGALLVAGAPAVGAVTAVATENAALRQSQEWHRTSAVLTQNARPAPDSVYLGSGDDRVRATVRWSTADGATRKGSALVDPGSRAGARTTVWLDGNGALKGEPATPHEALAQGMVLGALAATGTGLLALGGLWIVRFELDTHREKAWEREWAEIDPRWGTRRP